MRNLLAAAAAFVVLGGLSGCMCHHVAGKCDCDMVSTIGCCDPYGSVGVAVVAPAAPGAMSVKPEAIKEMPKEAPKKLPDK